MTTSSSDREASPSRLYRNPKQGILFGVCAGIAAYFGINPWVVRAFAILGLFMFAPATIISYVILALVLPRAPAALYRTESEERFWREVRVDPARSLSELRHRFLRLEQRLTSMEAYVTSDAYRVQREINDLER